MNEDLLREGVWVLHMGRAVHFPFPNTEEWQLVKYFIANPGVGMDKAKVLAEICQIQNATVLQDHIAENVVSSARHMLGGERVFPRYSRGGYVMDLPVLPVESLLPASPEIRVFPTPVKLHRVGHVLSEIRAGKNDSVDSVSCWTSTKAGNVPVIRYDNVEWALRVRFKHKIKRLSRSRDKQESYWYASLGLAGTSQNNWLTVDLRRYRVLRFEAKAKVDSGPGPITLRFRLKDKKDSADPNVRYNSTGWSDEFALRETYGEHPFTIDLDRLGWEKQSWSENTATPDRSAVHHVLFGHDGRTPPVGGTIWLRNIRFEA